MADTPPVSSSTPSTPPSSAADQARIRKERREAKIRAGGSARLNKITGLGGGVQRDVPPQPVPSQSHADPDEVDISNHYYEPRTTNAARFNANTNTSANASMPTDDQLRQMMLGFDPSTSTAPPNTNPFTGAGVPGGDNPFAGFPGMEGMGAPGGAAEDPMLKMLQQMMGGMPGDGAQGMPSFTGMPSMPGQSALVGDPYAYVWRIVHAVFALGLGIYIAFMTPFTGSRIERERSGMVSAAGDFAGEKGVSSASVQFFWIFATAEVLLQTSRFFMEKGRVQQSGIMGMVMGFLPEPWKGYLGLVSRYSRIWTTVTGDAMVCVFVLGVCAWLRGS